MEELRVAWPEIVPQKIKSWNGWPEDVRNIILRWNNSKDLSFSYTGTGSVNGIQYFICDDCNRFIEVRGSDRCVFKGASYCEDCLIELARNENHN